MEEQWFCSALSQMTKCIIPSSVSHQLEATKGLGFLTLRFWDWLLGHGMSCRINRHTNKTFWIIETNTAVSLGSVTRMTNCSKCVPTWSNKSQRNLLWSIRETSLQANTPGNNKHPHTRLKLFKNQLKQMMQNQNSYQNQLEASDKHCQFLSFFLSLSLFSGEMYYKTNKTKNKIKQRTSKTFNSLMRHYLELVRI